MEINKNSVERLSQVLSYLMSRRYKRQKKAEERRKLDNKAIVAKEKEKVERAILGSRRVFVSSYRKNREELK
jgi:hypothetical protein